MDKFLQNTYVVRLIALILAIILWFAVGPSSGGSSGTSSTYSKSLTGIPVSIVSDSDQYVVSNSVSKVNVIVTGGTFDITQLQTSLFSIKAVADIRGYAPGFHQVAISLQNIPDTIHYQIIPDVTTVTIEKKESKSVHVKVGVVGKPGNGYTADSPTLNISDVAISGPKEMVDRVVGVQAIVSVDGSEKTVHQNVPLVPVDGSGRQVAEIELGVKSVDVTIPIHAPTKSLVLQPSITGSVKNGMVVDRITVSPDHVTVSAPPDVLAKLGTALQLPAVDVTGLDQDKTFPVTIPALQGVTDMQPSTATVHVKVASVHAQTPGQSQTQSQSVTFSVPVTFVNTPGTMNAKMQENFTNADITVTGTTDQLAHVTADSIQVFGDLSGLNAGTHVVTLQAKVPDGVQMSGISPSSVHVSLTAKS
ncbi:hypothetical protein LSG31_06790 [Fodinisporobacter ferrooxydans]|uniref:YbbR domain-containing protein n=1 Tax=Fodinisporobacter ferrooxydans TaxID=2901836 RepID=A0ABY4CRT9_9BACL|nr:hypothetical protein LSG31_06790 [Alicyclobacillaceae bacterium MYW30-H2]